MNNKIQKHLKELRKKVTKHGVPLATVIIGTSGLAATMDYYDKVVDVIHTEGVTDIFNYPLFKAAFENDVDGFKHALEKGATITTSNRHNQNALMIALARESYDVSDYILKTPELRDKIDFRQSDDRGATATGIIDAKLRTEKDIGKMNKLRKTKEFIDDQLMKQIAKEKEGHARSDTKYDAFVIATQNAFKKGNIGK